MNILWNVLGRTFIGLIVAAFAYAAWIAVALLGLGITWLVYQGWFGWLVALTCAVAFGAGFAGATVNIKEPS